MPSQNDLQMQLLTYDANVALAELEASRAAERVKEIAYQKASFLVELQRQFLAHQQELVTPGANVTQPPTPPKE